MGADNTSRAKSFMSLLKNLCINAVRRSSRSFSVNERNIDFDAFPWPSNIARPNIVAGKDKFEIDSIGLVFLWMQMAQLIYFIFKFVIKLEGFYAFYETHQVWLHPVDSVSRI